MERARHIKQNTRCRAAAPNECHVLAYLLNDCVAATIEVASLRRTGGRRPVGCIFAAASTSDVRPRLSVRPTPMQLISRLAGWVPRCAHRRHFGPLPGRSVLVCKIYVDLRKSSLEVASTTLRLMLLIFSFEFISAFHPHRRVWFSSTFSRKVNVFHTVILNFDLRLSPTNLTYIGSR